MSAPLSEQQLAEIRARAEAATPGPWCTDDWEIYTGTEYLPWSSLWIGETCRADDCHGSRDDAAFIAAARTDVPALLAEVERLRAALGTATDEVAERDAEIGRWSARVAELEAQAAEEPQVCADCGHTEAAHKTVNNDPDEGGCDAFGARVFACCCVYFIPGGGR